MSLLCAPSSTRICPGDLLMACLKTELLWLQIFKDTDPKHSKSPKGHLAPDQTWIPICQSRSLVYLFRTIRTYLKRRGGAEVAVAALQFGCLQDAFITSAPRSQIWFILSYKHFLYTMKTLLPFLPGLSHTKYTPCLQYHAQYFIIYISELSSAEETLQCLPSLWGGQLPFVLLCMPNIFRSNWAYVPRTWRKEWKAPTPLAVQPEMTSLLQEPSVWPTGLS